METLCRKGLGIETEERSTEELRQGEDGTGYETEETRGEQKRQGEVMMGYEWRWKCGVLNGRDKEAQRTE